MTVIRPLVLALATTSFTMTSAHASPTPAPRVTPPATYANADRPAGTFDNTGWWHSFADPQLDQLVGRGRAENLDLATTQSRIDEANAVVIQTLSPLLPTATWDTTASMAPLDSLGFQFGGLVDGMSQMDLPELYYTASSVLKVGLEIDWTGRNVLKRRAAKRDADGSRADYEQQRVRLTADIVSAYYDVIAAKAQLDATTEQVRTNEQLLELTQMRFQAGQATAVDVLQQKQQTEASRTRVPLARTQVFAFEQRLAVLLGEAPGREFATPRALPVVPRTPDVGSPAHLQARRPDLRAANHRLSSATARKQSTLRQFAPSLKLQGQYGGQGIRIAEWRWQDFWNLGATLSVPLSTGGATFAQAKQATAVERTAARALDAATLAAIAEVENALMRERNQAEAFRAYEAQVLAAKAAFEESTKRYAAGLGDYLTVLTALATYQRSALDVITAHRDLIAYRIALHTALGDS